MEHKPVYRFHKIKYSPARGKQNHNTYEFQYDIILSRDEKGVEIKEEYTLICHEEPIGNFNDYLQGLKPHVVSLCELPADYVKRVEVRGISLSYNGENRTLGAVITGVMNYKKSNGVLVLNTPHKTENFLNESESGDPNQLIDEDCAELLYQLFKESEKYIKGERQQINIEFAEPAGKEPGELELVKEKKDKKKSKN